jgi:hypothetical protein
VELDRGFIKVNQWQQTGCSIVRDHSVQADNDLNRLIVAATFSLAGLTEGSEHNPIQMAIVEQVDAFHRWLNVSGVVGITTADYGRIAWNHVVLRRDWHPGEIDWHRPN